MGFHVRPQGCQVHVFQGNVSLQLVRPGQPASPPLSLAADQLATVGAVGVKLCATVTPGAAERMLFAQRTGRPVLSLPSRQAEEFAGTWLKSLGTEGQRRLAAVGSGQDVCAARRRTPRPGRTTSRDRLRPQVRRRRPAA